VKGDFISLSRNLEGIPFPPFMKDEERISIAESLKPYFESLDVSFVIYNNRKITVDDGMN